LAELQSVATEDEYGIRILYDPKSPVVEYVSIHTFPDDASTNLIHVLASFLFMV